MTTDYLLTEIAPGVTISDYFEWRENLDEHRSNIIELVDQRFNLRYLRPLENFDCSGSFATMALCCLLIEMFMSFQKKEFIVTKDKSRQIFNEFFSEYKNEFDCINGDRFFYDIRCGILHMGETRNGWRLSNEGDFLGENRIISVNLFKEKLINILENYIKNLKNEDLNSETWRVLILKLDAICENCKVII